MKLLKRYEILDIAVPSIISNITVPLLSLVDLTIVGHLGNPSYIAAIAVGGMVFNMIYWLCSFLRMGTTGIAAQYHGAGQKNNVAATLQRSLALALGLSLLQILFQEPVLLLARQLMETTPQVWESVSLYYHICIWGAPVMLMQYCFSGWFVAVQEARYPLYVALFQNVLNITCSAVFVFCLHLGVQGVALGTLIAQYGSLLLSFLFLSRWLRRNPGVRFLSLAPLRDVKALLRLFDVNKDIFLRTVCLVCVTLYFTSTGTEQGEIVLSANVFLMQFFTFYSYFMDGFAYAGESLTGKYYGAGDRAGMKRILRTLFRWGGGMALLFTGIYLLGGASALSLLTDNEEVVGKAQEYLFWVLCIPLCSVAAFLWDGVFVGLTATRQMLVSMFLAMAVFFCVQWIEPCADRNDTLWLAFVLYLLVRGMVQAWLYRYKISRKSVVWKG